MYTVHNLQLSRILLLPYQDYEVMFVTLAYYIVLQIPVKIRHLSSQYNPIIIQQSNKYCIRTLQFLKHGLEYVQSRWKRSSPSLYFEHYVIKIIIATHTFRRKTWLSLNTCNKHVQHIPARIQTEIYWLR